ncbi:MAG TPA: response regulator [Rhabdochlamydiaceae bacterium]
MILLKSIYLCQNSSDFVDNAAPNCLSFQKYNILHWGIHMENARIIIIDDQVEVREDCRANLESRDHIIVGEAASVRQAEDLIEGLTESDVDLAVVDGNLSRDTEGGVDGARITSLIHSKLPGVVVVGNSFSGSVRGADLNISKNDSWALDAIVTSLPERS